MFFIQKKEAERPKPDVVEEEEEEVVHEENEWGEWSIHVYCGVCYTELHNTTEKSLLDKYIK